MREKDRKTLEALSRARPDALDPTRLAGSTRQHDDLADLMAARLARTTETSARPTPARTTQTSARPAPARRLLLVPLVGVAVAAVVAAGAVVVGVAQHRTPQPTTQTARPDGHLLLLNMAASVRNQATDGPYWQFGTRNLNLSIGLSTGPTGKPYVIAETSESDWSIGVRPGEQSLLVSGIDAKRAPWGPQDNDRWQLAGSPATVDIDPGVKKSGTLAMPLGTGSPRVDHTNYGGSIAALGTKNVNYAFLQQLPSDETQLAGVLKQLYGHDGGAADVDQQDWMFTQVSNLITFPVSSAVRASAYRLLAALPGISSLGTVTDPLGRGGVGVALLPRQVDDLGLEQQQLIVDPTTSTILSQQTVLVTPSRFAASAGLTAGTVLYYQATTHIGWTGQQVELPTKH
ncbi:MAG TPA: CU044_5270 family protein [Pseudonocardiaceae bacterium]|jgi:hypothetical protein|nr:CU044_5270 family protein [Pseudonocardiaceae bacterium]